MLPMSTNSGTNVTKRRDISVASISRHQHPLAGELELGEGVASIEQRAGCRR